MDSITGINLHYFTTEYLLHDQQTIFYDPYLFEELEINKVQYSVVLI